MTTPYILVVDDEPDIRDLVKEILEDEGYSVAVADSARSARSSKASQVPDLVLLDIWMPGEDGISLLKDWRNRRELSFPVVMMSGHGTIETAVEATRLGAFDFVEKPLSLAKLLLVVEKALSSASNDAQFDAEGSSPPVPDELIGRSRYVENLQAQIDKLAETDAGILVSGEPATGKALLLRHVHHRSARANRPFVSVHCELLDNNIAVPTLFGTERGGEIVRGSLEQAAGGTLHLGEIGELSSNAQQALLAAMDDKRFVRVGGSRALPLTARITATSEVDLANSDFDQELFYKLNVIPVYTQGLRNHPEDIPALLEHYVDWFVSREDLGYRHFSVAAQNCLRNYNWPGNIRELKNLVQRLLVMGNEVDIDLPEVEAALRENQSNVESPHGLMSLPLNLPLREARAEFERHYLQQQLEASGGSIVELARRVGMERTNLYRKLRSLGIETGKTRA